jgi:hypothetical protein
MGHRSLALLACLPFGAIMLGAAAEARADVTSWLAIGGGYAGQVNHATTSFDSAAALSYSIGVGSSPIRSLVLGGLIRGTTMFGFGTDVGPVVRAATGGFARGDWGVALDAGALWRSWGNDSYGTWPVQGVLTVGAPWGLQLAMSAQFASVSGGTPSEGFVATLEVDLLRFTVMRQGATERWWPNPAPAGGHPGQAPPTSDIPSARAVGSGAGDF